MQSLSLIFHRHLPLIALMVMPGVTLANATGLVRDIAQANATEIQVKSEFVWHGFTQPGGPTIRVEFWEHDSVNPTGNVLTTTQFTPTSFTGRMPTGVVATVARDTVMHCTRSVMRIDDVLVAQAFTDHNGSYCKNNYQAFRTTPVPGGQVTDLSLAPDMFSYALGGSYAWVRNVLPDADVVVELWIHDSFQPEGHIVAYIGEKAVSDLGSNSSIRVATVVQDPVLSCTRTLMRIDGFIVAQDYTDHAGSYCAENYSTFDTLVLSEELFGDGFE